MEVIARNLVYNPPSLKFMCGSRIRDSISCMEENIENNLIEKLTTGDFDDLRDPNVPISLEDLCKYDTLLLQTLKSNYVSAFVLNTLHIMILVHRTCIFITWILDFKYILLLLFIFIVF